MESNIRHNDELICPLTYEWMDDPVTVPCCGVTFDRASLRLHFFHNARVCPSCKGGLQGLKLNTAPKNRLIASMVEQAKQGTDDQSTTTINNDVSSQYQREQSNAHESPSSWKVTFGHAPGGNSTALEVTCQSSDILAQQSSLLLIVVDRSGSMQGSPMTQVNQTLDYFMQLVQDYGNNTQVKVILYNDAAERYTLQWRNFVSADGRTDFGKACNEILRVLDGTQVPVNVLFMTDGKHNAMTTSVDLVIQQFSDGLANLDRRPPTITIHTVGFSRHHDFDVLNRIRQLGDTEGAYRYADPTEDTDSLSSKINGIAEVFLTNVMFRVRVYVGGRSPTMVHLKNGYGVAWVRDTFTEGEPVEIRHFDREQDYLGTTTMYERTGNPEDLLDKWVQTQTDTLMDDIMELNRHWTTYSSQQQYLLGYLLQRRGEKLWGDAYAWGNTSLTRRLESGLTTVAKIRAGDQQIDQTQLMDLKFEGQFSSSNVPTTTQPKQQRPGDQNPVPSGQYKHQQQRMPSDPGNIHPPIYTIRIRDNTLRTAHQTWVHELVLTESFCGDKTDGESGHPTIRHKENQGLDIPFESDGNDFTPLMLASYLGKTGAVKQFMSFECPRNTPKNRTGVNCLDIALVKGHWVTARILIAHGYLPCLDREVLCFNSLARNHLSTLQLLVENGFAHPKKEWLMYSMDENIAQWILAHVENDPTTTFQTALEKGFLNSLQQLDEAGLLPAKRSVSWRQYPFLLTCPTQNQVDVVQFLCDHEIVSPTEEWTDPDDEQHDILFPLFVAASKGQTAVVELLLQAAPQMIHHHNQRGATPLWIAVCNRRIEVVEVLLEYNADVNIPNSKGDAPLIPACQKGSQVLVELLLHHGCRL